MVSTTGISRSWARRRTLSRVMPGSTEALRSSMRMVMTDATETLNTAVYSGCREYHGEATIRFEAAAVGGEVQAAAAPASPLPAGMSLSLALTSPIARKNVV